MRQSDKSSFYYVQMKQNIELVLISLPTTILPNFNHHFNLFQHVPRMTLNYNGHRLVPQPLYIYSGLYRAIKSAWPIEKF